MRDPRAVLSASPRFSYSAREFIYIPPPAKGTERNARTVDREIKGAVENGKLWEQWESAFRGAI